MAGGGVSSSSMVHGASAAATSLAITSIAASFLTNMTEQERLPLTRMATIKSPYFWAFFGACVVLYIYNKSAERDAADVVKYASYGNYVCLAAFIGLFLTLVADTLRTTTFSGVLKVLCYVFEVASVGYWGILIFGHH